jgi:hypothetical protein
VTYKNCQEVLGLAKRSARRLVGDLQELSGGLRLGNKICQVVGG